MAIFTKESLETLRHKVDLVEVLRPHIDLRPAGAVYKALCPFHDEKTPSFSVQKGDSHYHCFGCGAHGDAIQFLMNYQKMSFSDAVQSLAEKFHVHLEKLDSPQEQHGPSKALLKEALEYACQTYHFCLLHTDEGHQALKYLFERGLDLKFIKEFQIGLAPKQLGALRATMMAKKVSMEIQISAGLLTEAHHRDFFSDRITFPIRDAAGAVIGFSARKYKEETFGGKYVNTPETPLFKKSRVLFGLNYGRRRIAKERKAIIVEGQIDALRLIYEGLNITVAGQGTAFGDGHVKEILNLGVNQVYLALDSDPPGQEAASKIGHLFQKEGVEVKVIKLPMGHDPDSWVRERGIEAFIELMKESSDYLTFLVRHQSRFLNTESPAGKAELVHVITKQVQEWSDPVMVHESLRKLAHLLNIPEQMVGANQTFVPNVHVKRMGSVGEQAVDSDRILETDFLRWLLLLGRPGSAIVNLAESNIKPEQLHNTLCRQVYQTWLEHISQNKPTDFLSLVVEVVDAEAQVLMAELFQKKIHKDRVEQHMHDTIKRILERNWMEEREEIRRKIQSGQCSDDEVSDLMKALNNLIRNPPQLK